MKKIILFISFQLVFSNCYNLKKQLKERSDYETAIYNSIIDFSETNLFNNGTVFNVNIEDRNDFYEVMIIKRLNGNKFLYSKSKKIEENILPTKYHVLDEKLFVWFDKNYIITEDTFNVLNKYGLLKDDEGWMVYPELIIDEKLKAATYYICKNDLKVYKRRISNKVVVISSKLKCK